jgi:hypothetical protein
MSIDKCLAAVAIAFTRQPLTMEACGEHYPYAMLTSGLKVNLNGQFSGNAEN